MVKIPIVRVVTKWLIELSPHIILITGHAGDGRQYTYSSTNELSAFQNL